MAGDKLLGPGPEECAGCVSFRRQIVGLEQELREARAEALNAKQASSDAIEVVRALQNSPLAAVHTVLKMVFGEISRVEVAATAPGQPGQAVHGHDPRWESWKSKVGARAREAIDLLLLHKEMNGKQLCAALRCDPRTLKNIIYELNKASLLEKNGGKYALKPL